MTPARGSGRIPASEGASKPTERAAARSGAASDSAALSDLDAVERARNGDHQAFRVLVERYQGRAFGLALRVLRDEERARDAVQDAFLKAYRSLDRFEGRSSFYTWFYRVVMNLCLDAKRREPDGRSVEWDEAHAGETPVGTGLDAVDPDYRGRAGPAAELERAELRLEVQRAIEALPDDARRTLVLREVDGLSYAEIAEALGIPKGTVMSRLHHARRRVRALLEERGVVKGES